MSANRQVIAVILLALFGASQPYAQERAFPPRFTIAPRTGTPAEGYPRAELPRWTIPPLTPAGAIGAVGLPLPPIGIQPDRPKAFRHRPWPGVVFVPVPQTFFVAAPVFPPAPEASTPAPAVRTGRLVLEIEPAEAQVFVDGVYVGTAAALCLSTGGIDVDAGVRHVDLGLDGFEPASIPVRVDAGRVTSYSARLQRIVTSPVRTALLPSTGSKTFYYIPGCYMGNVPPAAANLPPACDPAQAVVFAAE